MHFVWLDTFDGLTSLNTLLLSSGKLLDTLHHTLFGDQLGPLNLGLSDRDDNSAAPWMCKTLCWLKEKIKAGNVKWFVNSDHSFISIYPF